MFGVQDERTRAAVRAFVKLMRATRAVSARTECELARCALTPTQLGVLEALLHLGPLGQRDLGRKVLTSPANMTDVLDKLERRGLVRRERGGPDRRQVCVTLTDGGRCTAEAVFPRHAGAIAAAFAGLTDSELAQLDTLLRRLGHAAAADRDLP